MPKDHLDAARLAAELRQSLQDNIFSGRLRVSPHRADQISQELATSVLHFEAREQEPDVCAYGEQLAQEGVGHRAILALMETLRRVCWESCGAASAAHTLIGRYAFALLEGYMAGRETYLLEEQERARRAFERARENNG